MQDISYSNFEWSDMNSKKYPRPEGLGYFFEFMSDHSQFSLGYILYSTVLPYSLADIIQYSHSFSLNTMIET